MSELCAKPYSMNTISRKKKRLRLNYVLTYICPITKNVYGLPFVLFFLNFKLFILFINEHDVYIAMNNRLVDLVEFYERISYNFIRIILWKNPHPRKFPEVFLRDL